MRLSIILPVYNVEKYIARCLDSLLDQDLPQKDYEIIIINDESKDSSLKIAEKYASSNKNIVIYSQKNGGAGAARNTGLRNARGKYIHFVDPDDYITNNVYGTLIKTAEGNQLDIFAFDYVKIKNGKAVNNNHLKSEYDTNVNVTDGITFMANNNHRTSVWWFIIKRDFIEHTGLKFIEGRWMEDSILTPQLFLKAKRMAKINIPVYNYMIVPNSAMTSTEPQHYKKLIYDIENATYVFDNILDKVPTSHKGSADCKRRIKTRQQSFVFFLLIRLMKSELPIKHIPEMLIGFKKIKAYPLNYFPGKDFNGLSYKMLTFVFNKEKLMYPFMKGFRLIYRPLGHLVK